MSLSACTSSTGITQAVLDALLTHLAAHFLDSSDGDLAAARHAASRMLASYDTRTEEELHLAADIISFGLHALAALSQATEPDLPLNKVLRLRGGAVSLSREAHKARRRLDQLRRTRADRVAEPVTPEPAVAAAPLPGPTEVAPDALQPTSNMKPWTQSRMHRLAAEQITENLRRQKAAHERRVAEAAAQALIEAAPSHAIGS